MEGEYLKFELLLVELTGTLTKRRTIRVGIVEIVAGRTLIEEGVQIDLDRQLGQGHTLWFDLGPSDFEGRYDYTMYCCRRRDQGHEETEHLLRKDLFLRDERIIFTCEFILWSDKTTLRKGDLKRWLI